MVDLDLFLAFLLMALLFLRQIYIIKQPNKLNYAPLTVGIGGIGSVVHFIMQPDTQNIVITLKESSFPLLVSLLLYIVMNILHQTQKTENSRTQNEFTKTLVSQVTLMKEYMLELEARMNNNREEERKAQLDLKEKFTEMEKLYKNISVSFEHFTNVQLPDLDNVVHKHIDMFRISEQDHYNQVKILLSKAIQSRTDISDDIALMKTNIDDMKNISQIISKEITEDTIVKLSGTINAFEKQLITLKTHTEGVTTSLSEGENILSDIRQQSEMVMKQMLLSAKKMDEVESQNDGIHDVYSPLKELIHDIEIIKADYVKSQSQLSVIAQELKISEKEQIDAMKNHIETLSSELARKIDDSLDKLHEHYHIADEDITSSVQILAKKAQLQKGYSS